MNKLPVLWSPTCGLWFAALFLLQYPLDLFSYNSLGDMVWSTWLPFIMQLQNSNCWLWNIIWQIIKICPYTGIFWHVIWLTKWLNWPPNPFSGRFCDGPNPKILYSSSLHRPRNSIFSDDLDPKGLGFPVCFFSFIPLISLPLSPLPPPNLFLNTIRSKGKDKRG